MELSFILQLRQIGLPIPLREMDTNKLITQNPGYGS
jgi:hypothetical protein